MQHLIDLGAELDIADTKNQRAIYYAIQANRFEMVKFLIDKGANLQIEDKKGMTPTHWAKKQNQMEILTLLLENGGVPLDAKKAVNQSKKVAKPAEVA